MGRNSSKALTSPKVSKTQKKVPEDVNNQENRASQMITSSARKKNQGCETTESFSNGSIFSLAFHISRNTEGEIVDGGSTQRLQLKKHVIVGEKGETRLIRVEIYQKLKYVIQRVLVQYNIQRHMAFVYNFLFSVIAIVQLYAWN
ncbi:unnamed protein product [Lactuca saligna]|uniref:Uncharacterized protein n=1 Tax=Lactuca saligna TaxID=75948 RepID=A0AA36E0A4_LACSI|nr:unnamed protein product [Lactuca saligna]